MICYRSRPLFRSFMLISLIASLLMSSIRELLSMRLLVERLTNFRTMMLRSLYGNINVQDLEGFSQLLKLLMSSQELIILSLSFYCVYNVFESARRRLY